MVASTMMQLLRSSRRVGHIRGCEGETRQALPFSQKVKILDSTSVKDCKFLNTDRPENKSILHSESQNSGQS